MHQIQCLWIGTCCEQSAQQELSLFKILLPTDVFVSFTTGPGPNICPDRCPEPLLRDAICASNGQNYRSICLMQVRRGVITNHVKTFWISEIHIRKLFRNSKRTFFRIWGQDCTLDCIWYSKMFRISQANVSDITFRISFWISKRLFGFVVTPCLMISLMWTFKSRETIPNNIERYFQIPLGSTIYPLVQYWLPIVSSKKYLHTIKIPKAVQKTISFKIEMKLPISRHFRNNLCNLVSNVQ